MKESGSEGCEPEARFANGRVLVGGWYAVARSQALVSTRVTKAQLGPFELALWRDTQGRVCALDAVCPHLGADLSQGQVVDGQLQCAFHGWCFDRSGQCQRAPGHPTAPGRSAKAWVTDERFGLVWVLVGREPLYALPETPTPRYGNAWWWIHPPPQTIGCHPHLVIANGLDAYHFDTLHGMALSQEPEIHRDGSCRVGVRLKGRPRSRWLDYLSGASKRDMDWTFTAIGPSAAWAHVTSPVEFHALFTARPTTTGRTRTQVALLLPRRPLAAFRALVGLYVQLHDDRRILENLRFHRGFTTTDEPLRAFADMVDQMPAIDAA